MGVDAARERQKILGIEGLAPYLDPRRRPEPIEESRRGIPPTWRDVNEVSVFVSPPVAGEADDRQAYFRFCGRLALDGLTAARRAALFARTGRFVAGAFLGVLTGRGAVRRASTPASRLRWTSVNRTSSPMEW